MAPQWRLRQRPTRPLVLKYLGVLSVVYLLWMFSVNYEVNNGSDAGWRGRVREVKDTWLDKQLEKESKSRKMNTLKGGVGLPDVEFDNNVTCAFHSYASEQDRQYIPQSYSFYGCGERTQFASLSGDQVTFYPSVCDGHLYYYKMTEGPKNDPTSFRLIKAPSTSKLVLENTEEAILVVCKHEDEDVLTDFELNRRSSVLFRIKKLDKKYTRVENKVVKDKLPTLNIPDPKKGDGAGLNVMFLFIDSLSRAQFYRSMPATAKVVREASSINTEWFDFHRYHAIGRRTPPNAKPMYTGYNADFLDQYFENAGPNHYVMDGEWIWDEYRHRGYKYAIADNDCPVNVGSVAWLSNALRTHEKYGTTSHLPRIATMMGHHFDHYGMSGLSCMLMNLTDATTFFSGPPEMCFGGRYAHNMYMEYIDQFWQAYPNDKKFGHMIWQEAHEASQLRVRSTDKDLAEWLDGFVTQHGDNTAIVLVSDHGLSFGDYFQRSPEGRVENLEPMMFVGLPQRFLNRNPNARVYLERNQDRLVSAVDLNVALRHLLNWPELPRLKEPTSKSLFVEIPKNRTCKDALVPEEFCLCLDWKPVDTVGTAGAAMYAVGQINSNIWQATEGEWRDPHVNPGACQLLELEDVKETHVMGSEKMDEENPMVVFRTRFTTKPGNGHGRAEFEADVSVTLWNFSAPSISFHHQHRTYHLRSLTQLTKYGPYEKCQDPRVPGHMCLCDMEVSESVFESDKYVFEEFEGKYQGDVIVGRVVAVRDKFTVDGDAELSLFNGNVFTSGSKLKRFEAFNIAAYNPTDSIQILSLVINGKDTSSSRPVPLSERIPPKSWRYIATVSSQSAAAEFTTAGIGKPLPLAFLGKGLSTKTLTKPYVSTEFGQPFMSVTVDDFDCLPVSIGVRCQRIRTPSYFVYQIVNKREFALNSTLLTLNNFHPSKHEVVFPRLSAVDAAKVTDNCGKNPDRCIFGGFENGVSHSVLAMPAQTTIVFAAKMKPAYVNKEIFDIIPVCYYAPVSQTELRSRHMKLASA